MEWNVLVTCRRGEERYLLEELEGKGNFKPSSFRDVVIGEVKDIEELLKEIGGTRFSSVSRVIPIDRTFNFRLENFTERLKNAVKPYVDRIGPDESFCVRFERRGYENRISSQKMEREIGSYLWEKLEEKSKEPKVDLEDPDKLIAVETIGHRCGTGLIPKELRKKYYFVRF